ncbi:unnamed protein product [Peronospora farinosa]|uniref:Uncharacterized protein n=1 Tax=Peronospora farinosa TaxID=134698 RepID=A0ABN8C2A3_9STRA|nr:unnamed protein product [Peronospora farinosa]
MDYRQLQSQPGNARLNGSNRAAWNAMDLEIGAQIPPSNARNNTEDCGALSARNVLLRQKLRERKRYDSADDAMKKAAARATSRYQKTPEPTLIPSRERPYSPAQMGQSAFFNAMNGGTGTKNVPTRRNDPLEGGALQARNVLIQHKLQTKMSKDDTDMADGNHVEGAREEAVSSPCASFTGTGNRRLQFASMSPSRAGKYGALENKKKPNRRDLLEQQDKNSIVAIGADEKIQQRVGGSDYGKLSAAHVLIRRKLKERKRFDSADYAMEKQGQQTDVPAEIAANPAAPGTAALRYSTIGTSQATINHQVKHIKLSESLNGRVASPAVANAAQAALAARAARYAGLKNGNTMTDTKNIPSQGALDRYGLDKSVTPLGAAAARNLVLQRKLAERKMFDSADHFKEAT